MHFLRSVFLLNVLLIATGAHAQTIYKCVDKGKTTYSESPCRPNDYLNNRFHVRNEKIGTVSPDRTTIEATRARIQAEMNPKASGTRRTTITTTTTTTTTRPNPDIAKAEECQALEKEIAHIDANARQALSAFQQNQLAQRKRNLQSRQYQLKCK